MELLLCCGRLRSAEGRGGADPTGLCGALSLDPPEKRCLELGLSTNRQGREKVYKRNRAENIALKCDNDITAKAFHNKIFH